MAAPTLISELSTTAGSNGPAGSVSPIELDDYARAHAAFIAQLRDEKAPIASPTLTGTATIPAITGLVSVNGGQLAGLRNRIINGNFGVNQRAVSGSVVLAAGAYGHDRWKAGASGCTYTFATSANVTTLTISAGSLQQVIEGTNLESGTYALSWTGTATGKIGAGSYAASGVTGAVTGGTNTTIEFSVGTVSKVQFEIGTATTFEQRLNGLETELCQRYGEPIDGAISGYAASTVIARCAYQMKVTKRATPTLSGTVTGYVNNLGGNPNVTGYSLAAYSTAQSLGIDFTVASGLTSADGVSVNCAGTLFASAEL